MWRLNLYRRYALSPVRPQSFSILEFLRFFFRDLPPQFADRAFCFRTPIRPFLNKVSVFLKQCYSPCTPTRATGQKIFTNLGTTCTCYLDLGAAKTIRNYCVNIAARISNFPGRGGFSFAYAIQTVLYTITSEWQRTLAGSTTIHCGHDRHTPCLGSLDHTQEMGKIHGVCSCRGWVS